MTDPILPRSIRNNNPGNLRPGPSWQGVAGIDNDQPDPPYLKFSSLTWGLRAVAKTLLAYQTIHGLHTAEGVINRWAPPSDDNPTSSYIAAVAGALGVGPTDTIDLRQRATLIVFVRAICVQEGGHVVLDFISDQQIGTAVDLALATLIA